MSPLLVVCFDGAPAAAQEERATQSVGQSLVLKAPLRQRKRKDKRSAVNPREPLRQRQRKDKPQTSPALRVPSPNLGKGNSCGSAPQAYSNTLVQLMTPTSDQRTIVSQAVGAAKKIFSSGYGYKKAGVIATKIVGERDVVRSLFEDGQSVERERRISSALDSINSAFGAGTIKLAVQGSGCIKTTSENQSPHYTTRWSDIPKVVVK